MPTKKRVAEFVLVDPDPTHRTEWTKGINPFTGEVAEVSSEYVVWPEGRREALDALLASRKPKLDAQGILTLSFREGPKVSFFLGIDDSGEDVFTITIVGDKVSEEAGDFLFRVVEVAGRVLLPINPFSPHRLRTAVLDAAFTPKAEEEYPKTVRLKSKADFLKWLAKIGDVR